MNNINDEITKELRAFASKLLASGEVVAFLGYTKGSFPMTTRPYVAKTPEDAQKMVWNSFCVLNLANYLPVLLKSVEPPRGPKDPPPEGPLPKVGVIATGCWSRNIVVQTQENQVDRTRLVIAGVSSRGMVDRKKVQQAFLGKEITKVDENDHKLFVEVDGKVEELNRWSVVRDNCQSCVHSSAVVFDRWIGPKLDDRQSPSRFKQVEDIETMTADERWAWFSKEIETCIRCYACRNACPLCYCETCFVDDSNPQWVGKSIEQADTAIFHLLRAFHCAGRCTDCGACESACPMGIRMRLLTKKLEKDVFELFGDEAGMDASKPLTMTTYKLEDPQGFIFEPKHGQKKE